MLRQRDSGNGHSDTITPLPERRCAWSGLHGYEIDASDSASPMTSRIEFDYDGLARPETITSWIDLTPGEEEAFQLKYKYEDKVNRRTQVEAAFVLMDGGTETDAMPDYRIDYDWDKLNRVDMISQSNLNYDANPANWGIEANSTETVDLQYRADSSYDEIIRTDGFGNSITTDFTYHSDGQKHEGLLASMNHEWETNPFGATDSAAYALTFDDHNRVATYTTPEGTRTYGYDNVDQLTSVTGSSTESYQYDANGNRSSGTTVSAYNRITQDADYNYTYDKDGNRLTRTDRTTLETEFYSWDYRHRLTQVVIRSSSSESSSFVSGVEYEYDALDRRTIRRELISDPNQTSFGPPLLGGVEQRFLYDSNVLNGGFDEVVLIIDEAARKFSTSGGTGGFGGGFGDGGGSGNSTPETGHEHVQHRFLNGADVDQVFADETTTDFLWYLTDHQNSVTDVVESESSGATNRNHIEYDSFGNIITVDDPSTATADDGDLPGEDDTYSPVRGYTGREPDALTGLIYYRARWFDPNTGTFVSEDPIGFAAGDTNLTRYVGNGTPNATDPSGLQEGKRVPRPVGIQEDRVTIKPEYFRRLSRTEQERFNKVFGKDAERALARYRLITKILSTPSTTDFSDFTFDSKAYHESVQLTRTLRLVRDGNRGSIQIYKNDRSGFAYWWAGPNYEFVTSIPYNANEEGAREIAIGFAKRLLIGNNLKQYMDAALNGIVAAPENAVRTVFPGANAACSTYELGVGVSNGNATPTQFKSAALAILVGGKPLVSKAKGAAAGSVTARLRSLRGTAKDARWAKADGPAGLRGHFGKHGSQVGAKTAREFDLSARLTIQNCKKFRYRDRATGKVRTGYWDAETGLFTATSQTRRTAAIMTHFPETWARLRKLPGFSTLD